MTYCSICNKQAEIEDLKHFSLYVFGSEGIQICRSCELDLVGIITVLRRISGRVSLHTYKRNGGK